MDFSWSADYPDLHKICKLYQLREVSNPKAFKYTPLPGILQDGPQCGLVALAMFTDHVTKETVDELMIKAKARGYTFNGEMFSAVDMCNLARDVLEKQVQLYDGALNDESIKEFLLHGGCMLVPYDADKNHSPCLKGGHKAHWAAVSGIIETEDIVFTLARHGKSKNVAIWNLDDLSKSNAQLIEFSPDRNISNVKYKVPLDGIAGVNGICNKAILIK